MVVKGRKVKADTWMLIGQASPIRVFFPGGIDIRGFVQGFCQPGNAKYSALGKRWIHRSLNDTPEQMRGIPRRPSSEVGKARSAWVRDVETNKTVFGMFGSNLMVLDGEEWKHHRKVVQRAFTEQSPRLVWAETTAALDRLFQLWDTEHGARLTLMVISAAVLGRRLSWKEGCERPWPGYTLSFQKTLEIVSSTLLERALTPKWAIGWTAKSRAMETAHAEFEQYLRQMMDIQRRKGEYPEDLKADGKGEFKEALLNALVAASDDETTMEGKGLMDDEVIGNTFLFLFAGHDTTATALASTLGLLALYPRVQEEVYSQIRQVMGSRSHLEYSDLDQLKLVSGAFLETLRMYPPAIQNVRLADQDTSISVARHSPGLGDAQRETMVIPSGTYMTISHAAIHYNPIYWPEPDEFCPSRFSGAYNSDAFVPFSTGAKVCPGQKFAEAEGIAALAAILARYEISVDSTQFPDIIGESIQDIARLRAPFVRDLKTTTPFFGVFGENMVVVEGEEWKHHRRIAQKAFTEKTPPLVWAETIMALEQLFELWNTNHGSEVHVRHIKDITSNLGLIVISSVAMGHRMSWIEDYESPWPGYTMSFQKAMRIVSRSIIQIVLTPKWAEGLTESTRTASTAFAEAKQYLREMIDIRRKGGRHSGDTLGTTPKSTQIANNIFDVLVAASDEDVLAEGKGLTDDQVIGNTFLFLFAGHETTASALAFALGLLALYPQVQQELYEEAKQVLGSRPRLEYSDIGQLKLVSGAFFETLRLYPPATQNVRLAEQDTIISVARNGPGSESRQRENIVVPAKSYMFISHTGIHYNPTYWPEPEEFRPSRFSGAYNRDAFVPFSTGGKVCIGQKFSETEGTAALASILLQYEVSIDTSLFPDVPGEAPPSAAVRSKPFLDNHPATGATNISPSYLKWSLYHFGKDGFVELSITNPKECVVFIADPQAYKDITRPRSPFVRDLKAIGPFFSVFGENLLSLDGEEWKHHRKIAQRAFTEKTPLLVWTETTTALEQLFELWDANHGPRVRIPHIKDVTANLALIVISSVAMGHRMSWIEDYESPWPGYTMSFQKAMRIVSRSVIPIVMTPRWAEGLTENTRTVGAAFSEAKRYLREMIDRRRRDGSHLADKSEVSSGATQVADNIFDVLVAASDEDALAEGKGLTDDQVIGNTFLFLFAGHETTASALAFALGLLALYPKIQQELYEEIEGVMQPRPRLEYTDIEQLKLVSGAFLETIRLYSPATQNVRIAEQDTVISVARNGPGRDDGQRENIVVPANSYMFISHSGIHYNPTYWPEPEEFRPSRFSGAYNRDAFVPFSTGGKVCIGQKFSETEGTTALASILSRYEVSVDTTAFPDIPGESMLARRARLLKASHSMAITPRKLPLVFTRRT
ncbi:cytochrome P450 family protein [Ceratobasidium sp. AG-Ba]|nr:cytochrome P450 family protein [Ceratobasidium sp. AG-Ba]